MASPSSPHCHQKKGTTWKSSGFEKDSYVSAQRGLGWDPVPSQPRPAGKERRVPITGTHEWAGDKEAGAHVRRHGPAPSGTPSSGGSRVQSHWESRTIPIYGGLGYTATLKTVIYNMQSSILTREDSSGRTLDCGKWGRKS